MDPNQTLSDLLEAFADGDRDSALEHLDDLRTWLKMGGFMPRLTTAGPTSTDQAFEDAPRGPSGKE